MKRFFNRISIATIILSIAISASCICGDASSASAHEVYVLSPAQVTQALGTPPFDMIAVIRENLGQFVFWAFISILTIISVFCISIIRSFERFADPFLARLRPYAPFVARVTVGLSLLAAAYYQASYGPELPLVSTYGSLTGLITIVLVVIGTLITIGLYARIAACIALVMFSVAVYFHGWYMLTYANYIGEIIVILALGAHRLSLDSYLAGRRAQSSTVSRAALSATETARRALHRISAFIAPRSIAIMRICLGISLIFASAYAKIIYNNLALFTVLKYHLDHILGFEPHFLVLGAAIIEVTLGMFVILGIEIRFTALFFEFWLTLSLCFFGEVVWPHIILIGLPIALFLYGYDRYSIEGFFFKKKKYEPVL
jgi:uncharacterized membrane protein YphA (DoxX/SURF4 family)